MPPLPTALFIGRDLFFASKVTGTAKALGLRVEVVGDAAQAIERLQQAPCRCLFVDLANDALNLAALMDNLPEEQRPTVIAFGAHVATASLEAARAAGCDDVMPRSKFSSMLPDILRKYLVHEAS